MTAYREQTDKGLNDENSLELNLSNPEYEEVVNQSTTNAVEAISNQDPETFVEFVASQKRVRSAIGPQIGHSGISEDILGISDSIAWDMDSYAGIPVNPRQAESLTISLAGMNFAFMPLVDAKVRLTPKEALAGTADKQEVASTMQGYVNYIIWNNWVPSGNTPEDIILSFRHYLMGSLRHIPQMTRHILRSQAPLLKLNPDSDEFDIYEYAGSCISDDIEAPKPTEKPLVELEQEWLEIARGKHVAEVITLVMELPARQQLAIWDKWGYSNTGGNQESYGRQHGISESTSLSDYRSGLQSLSAATLNADCVNPKTTAPNLRYHIANIAHESLFFNNGRLAKPSSLRVQALEYRDHPDLRTSLTDTQIQRLMAATDIQGQNFTHSTSELEDALGVKYDAILQSLRNSVEILEGKESSYVYRDGRRISSKDSIFTLIEHKKQQGSIAHLTPKQATVYQFLTTPDENGRYPTIQELTETTGVNREYPSKIAALINQTSTTTEPKVEDPQNVKAEIDQPENQEGEEAPIRNLLSSRDSARLGLFWHLDRDELSATLGDNELKLFYALTQLNVSSYKYTTAEIAEQFGISRSSVKTHSRQIARKLSNIGDPSNEAYVRADGKPLTTSSAQCKFIRLRKQESQERIRELLTARQFEVFTILTTPDENGRYPVREKALKKHGIWLNTIRYITKALKPLTN